MGQGFEFRSLGKHCRLLVSIEVHGSVLWVTDSCVHACRSLEGLGFRVCSIMIECLQSYVQDSGLPVQELNVF